MCRRYHKRSRTSPKKTIVQPPPFAYQLQIYLRMKNMIDKASVAQNRGGSVAQI